MINVRTELQYQIALGILARMKAAGFVTDDEAEAIRRLAAGHSWTWASMY